MTPGMEAGRTLFWVSAWVTGDYPCMPPEFVWFESGYRGDDDNPEMSVCFLAEAENEDDVKAAMGKYFDVTEVRFIEDRPDGWRPGVRFPGAVPNQIPALSAHKDRGRDAE